jgi:hypothetical protein
MILTNLHHIIPAPAIITMDKEAMDTITTVARELRIAVLV